MLHDYKFRYAAQILARLRQNLRAGKT